MIYTHILPSIYQRYTLKKLFLLCIGLFSVNIFFYYKTFAAVTTTDSIPPANVPMTCSIINKDNKNEVLVRLQKLQTEDKKTFDEAYKTVKKEYHDRINDIFNKRMQKLNNNIYQSNSQNRKLCSPFKFEKETKSIKVAREVMQYFRKYECALTVYVEHPPYSGKEFLTTQGTMRLNTIKVQLQQEIRVSYLAIKETLDMYNELRLWFPIHRDLLCLIEQMKTYRNALRNFIDQVVRMPSKYYNYASRYQQ